MIDLDTVAALECGGIIRMNIAGGRRVGDNGLMTEESNVETERTLEELLADAWAGLSAAVTEGRHEWHVPVVSTMASDGWPSARVVVLRGVWPEAPGGPVISCHTDLRSEKVRELGFESGGSRPMAWTFYERIRKVQLRVRGETTVHSNDDVANEAWSRTPTTSRRCYMAPHGPSGRLDSWHPNLPDAWRASVPDEASSEAGRVNFAVIRTRVSRLERLELHHDGHVRSAWRWEGASLVDSTWLAP